MDMEVDSNVLRSIAGNLTSADKRLGMASQAMRGNVQRAGGALEGKQYTLSRTETFSAAEIVEGVASNLKRTADYLEKLAELVEEYAKCGFKH